MDGLGYELSKLIADLGAGGGIDLPDCAVGSLCAQTDIDSAKFIENVKKKYPEPLKKMNASLKIVLKRTDKAYGYMIGVDADGVVHEYKGVPIQKIMNIWNYGSGDGKTPRTMFWGKAIRALKYKYDRAADRFFDILDKRWEGKVSHAKNSGTTVEAKMVSYSSHKNEYMSAEELQKVRVLNGSEVLLND